MEGLHPFQGSLDDTILVDAILDCIVHSSHKIDLEGTALRNTEKHP